jgi:hypothetical protein
LIDPGSVAVSIRKEWEAATVEGNFGIENEGRRPSWYVETKDNATQIIIDDQVRELQKNLMANTKASLPAERQPT